MIRSERTEEPAVTVDNVPNDARVASCVVCKQPLSGLRPARYCSVRCRVRAHRQRRQIAQFPDAKPKVELRRRLRQLPILYRCGECEEIYEGERRCGSCNRFCKRLGPALACPHCDELIGLEALLESALEEVPS